MPTGAEMFSKLVNYQYSESESVIAEVIVNFVKKKYGADVYKCAFFYNENGKLKRNTAYMKTTAGLNSIMFRRDKKIQQYNFPEDNKNIRNSIIAKDSRIEVDPDYRIVYSSFEREALEDCYRSAYKAFEGFIKEHYNPETMESIDTGALFVIYKTRELMEQAEKSGEHEHLREEYYKFIKKFDTYNYITMQKHLLVHFDYVGHARSPREYCDMYWDMLAAEK